MPRHRAPRPGLVAKVGPVCGVAPAGDGVARWSGAPGSGGAFACGSTAGDALGSRNTSVGRFGRVTMVTARPGGSSVGVCSWTSPIAVVMRSWPGMGLSATMPLTLTGLGAPTNCAGRFSTCARTADSARSGAAMRLASIGSADMMGSTGIGTSGASPPRPGPVG
jgi:hypothetical protein